VAFPQSVLPIKQEMLIDGTWTDITTRTRNSDNVDITRGYSGEQTRTSISPGSSAFTLNNRDYFFSNRSPSSANYGLIGRNTQYRASITESTAWLFLADYSDTTGTYDGARASTADKAVLDVTGDIDVRVDCRPDDWRGGHGMALVSKYNTGTNNRSWLFWLDREGYLHFRWSTDGTLATVLEATSTAVVSALRRQALRVTLDVNNGAAGWTATFYTSDTIAGSWTALGSAVTTAGTTSIYASTADLHVGTIHLSTASTGTQGRGVFFADPHVVNPFCGRVYRAQVYNGIAGTLVADMDATSQAAGTTSWSDGLSTANTWALAASAEITKQNYRFWGELPSFPQEWDVSGRDIFGRAQAFDLISRKQQGSKSLRSAVYRNLIRFTTTGSGTSGTMDGYWPMENGSQATVPSPAVGTFGTMSNCVFSTDDEFPGTTGVLTWSSDSGKASGGGVYPAGTSATGVVTLLLYFRAPTVPAADVNLISYYLIGGNTYQVNFTVGTATYKLNITDGSGTSLLSTTAGFGTGGEPNQPLAMRLMLTQNGANVDYEWAWYPIGAATLFGVSGSYAGTIGRPQGGASKTWYAPPATNKSGWWIAQVAVMREDVDWEGSAFIGSTNAYVGERPEIRFGRLCREESVPYWIIGRVWYSDLEPDVGETMGPQTAQAFMALITECATLDRGLLYGPRDKFGLTLRLHNSLILRDCVELDYGQKHLSPPFIPRDDLFFARNDVTVTNATGGSARQVKTTGKLNTSEPAEDPDGIGTYDPGPITRIAEDDDRLPVLAQEEVFHGTWDEVRYPNVSIERARSVFTSSALLDADLLDLDLGDALRLTNLPAQMPPDDVEMLVLGYAESLQNRAHPITWNTEPYGPYRYLNDLSASTLARARLAGTSSTLSGSINTTDNSFSVATASGPLWVTGSSAPTFPMECMVGGEEISVGSISGSSSPQTFSSVTRSVNGQVLSHASGAEIQVRDAFYLGRDKG
jgi:hypothetical protein